MKRILISFFMVVLVLVAGCAPNISSNNYDYQNYGAANKVVSGVIVSSRPVQVNKNTGVGGVSGAVAGGAAGSAIGSGIRAGIIGAVGGAVIGGLLGNAVEKGVSRSTGIEYIVKTTKGNMISVVQAPQPYFPVGSYVNVILGDPARIVSAG
jgi:outer membrane lipoprotein SlyB